MKAETFDCVAMKHEIQQRLRERHGRRPWSERNVAVRESLLSDPHLSRLLDAAPSRAPQTEKRDA